MTQVLLRHAILNETLLKAIRHDARVRCNLNGFRDDFGVSFDDLSKACDGLYKDTKDANSPAASVRASERANVKANVVSIPKTTVPPETVSLNKLQSLLALFIMTVESGHKGEEETDGSVEELMGNVDFWDADMCEVVREGLRREEEICFEAGKEKQQQRDVTREE